MKLFKHSYSYGSKQSSFSKYEHHQYMSQPNYVWNNKPCYDGSARDYVLSQSMCGFDANESNHARFDDSINYNAQAQSAFSNPSIRVKQGHHAMEGINKNESHIGHNKSTVFSSPNHLKPIKTTQPSIIEHKEDNDWANSTSNFTSPTHGDPNPSSKFSSPSHGQRNSSSNFFSMTHSQRLSATSNFSSPTHDQGNSTYTSTSPTHGRQHLGLATDKEGPLMEKMDHDDWDNSTSRFSSPTHVQHSSLGMQKDDHLKRKMDRGWANSPTKFSSSTPTHQLAQTAYNNEHTMHKRDHGWAYSPNRFSNSTQTHHTSLEEMGRHGGDNSPSKLYSPTKPHHSNLEMHKQDNLTRNMNHGWVNSPTKHYGPNNLYNSNHTQNTQHGWDQKSSNGFGPIQVNHPTHTSYNEYDQHVDGDVHDIMDEILSKNQDHNVGNGPGRSGWASWPSSYTGPNQSGGYANQQQTFGGLAQYGGAIQSMNRSSSKFALNMEMNVGSSSNFGKEEYYSSSSFNSKKFTDIGAYW